MLKWIKEDYDVRIVNQIWHNMQSSVICHEVYFYFLQQVLPFSRNFQKQVARKFAHSFST